MKKRMFITTIVMTLVLAIALTTSSLAWFSSANLTVTAQAATFTAKTAGSNTSLKISTDGVRWGNSIALDDKANLAPVIPVKALKAANGTAANYTTYVNGQTQAIAYGNYVWDNGMSFNTAMIDSNGEFVIDADNNGQVAKLTAIEYVDDVKTAVDALNDAVTAAGDDDAALAAANAAIAASDYLFVTSAGKNQIVIETENETSTEYVFNKERAASASTNKVKDAAASDYYSTYFYLMNGDMQTSISALDFAIIDASVELSATPGTDHNTANSYVAVIVSRNVETAPTTFVMNGDNYEEDGEGKYIIDQASIVPANAHTHAGAYVIAYGVDTSKLPAEIGANYFTLASGKTVSNDYVPFAAFTYKIPSSDTSGSWYLTDDSWQYADLDEIVPGATNPYKDQYFKYNAVEQTSNVIARQDVQVVVDPANAGGNSYTLNQANLRTLNASSGTPDSTSTFAMFGKEVFRVDVYFWLDGLTLDEYTDATVTTFGLSVTANQ